MPQTTRSRRRLLRRPGTGTVAAKVLRVVRERRRLLAIRAQIDADYQTEIGALTRVLAQRMAQIDAQLRALDRGLVPEPLRDDETD